MDPKPLILVAEDDFDMRALLREWLEREEYVVEEVSSGVELAERIARAWVEGNPDLQPALIVSDIRMPGFNGLSVLGALHRIHGHIPFIVVTAFGDAEVHSEAARIGALAVLDKPVERWRFIATVEDALAAS